MTCRVEWQEIMLSAPYPAEVTAIYVEEGQDVVAGNPLLVLDIDYLETQLEGAIASIDAAEHRIKQLEIIRKQIDKNLKRARSLEIIGGVSKYNIEELETQLQSNLEGINAAKKTLEAESKKAELLKKQIRDSVLRSPVNGVLQRILVEKGERVLPGFTLLKIVNPSDTYARCYISHSALPYISAGNIVEVINSRTRIYS